MAREKGLYILFNNRNDFFFFFFFFGGGVEGGAVLFQASKRCMALYMTMPDPMQHATPHSPSPATTSKFSPGLAMFPDQFKLNRTHLGRVVHTRVQERVNAPAHECEWFHATDIGVPGTLAGVGGHPIVIQSMPKRC